MGNLNLLTRSVMLRKLRRLRVTAIFYTCIGLCAILLLVNFNEDVKRLLQQSSYSSGPHLPIPQQQQQQTSLSGPGSTHHYKENFPSKKIQEFQEIDLEDNELKIDSASTTLLTTSPSPVTENDHSDRPWYMWGGRKYPTLASGVPSTSVDDAKLWYEDNLNNDRVLDQLMFWIDDPVNNPNYSLWYDAASLTSTPSGEQYAQRQGEASLVPSTGTGEDFASRKQQEKYLSRIAQATGSVQISAPSNETGLKLLPPSGGRKGKLKTILLYYGLGMSWGPHVVSGRSLFIQQKCPVNACRLTGNRAYMAKSDIVLFKDVFMNPKVRRSPSQLWVMYMLECPLNTQNFVDKNVFNLTATYRHDSDIVTPYEKWVYYDEGVKTLKQDIDYAAGKTKKVAWFVSNCVAKNNRLDYARELSKYIQVDIYGACGTHSCSRANAKQCFDLLAKNYKFYLAFENSNCRDYISEKFFVNGLGNNVLPIVMGAHPDDYKRVAPLKSYIHVDDFPSPKELADYLYLLDGNNELYNEYFQWKGTGEFINTHFFCRLCAMAHYAEKSERKPRYYKDFNKWWRGPNVCTRRSWRGQPDIFSKQYYERPTADGY